MKSRAPQYTCAGSYIQDGAIGTPRHGSVHGVRVGHVPAEVVEHQEVPPHHHSVVEGAQVLLRPQAVRVNAQGRFQEELRLRDEAFVQTLDSKHCQGRLVMAVDLAHVLGDAGEPLEIGFAVAAVYRVEERGEGTEEALLYGAHVFGVVTCELEQSVQSLHVQSLRETAEGSFGGTFHLRSRCFVHCAKRRVCAAITSRQYYNITHALLIKILKNELVDSVLNILAPHNHFVQQRITNLCDFYPSYNNKMYRGIHILVISKKEYNMNRQTQTHCAPTRGVWCGCG